MFKRMIFTAAALLTAAGYGADGITIDNLSGARKENQPAAVSQKTAEEEKAEKVAELTRQRKELIRKIQQKRKELLKNNPKLRRMYQQLLKQTRELALELDANREMRQLNDDLGDIDRRLKNELESKPDKGGPKPKKSMQARQ